MFVKQLSLFLENRSGRLVGACNALATKGINILALSLADTADFGILRLIVSDPDAGAAALKGAGFTVITNDVLAIEVEDQPGGLAHVLNALTKANVNIEYMYAFSSMVTKRAPLIFRFEDNERAVDAITAAGINVLKRVDLLDRPSNTKS